MLLRYKTHLNVEIVTAAEAVKYLFKYIFKGADSATAAIRACQPCHSGDEISEYERLRYIGSAEACWRIFDYAIVKSSDSYVRMYITLHGDRTLLFDDGEEDDNCAFDFDDI